MTEVATPVAEWRKKGTKLFGKDTKKWRFVCPICETVSSVQDFIDTGVTEDQAYSSAIQECIGRHIQGSQEAIGKSKVIKGNPRNYAAYGFFKINLVPVEDVDGEVIKIFDFA